MTQTLYQNLNSNIEKFLKKNQKIVVGVSGGQDSCVLLDILLKSNLNFRINVCHFNHMLRDVASDEDERFVRDFCIKNSIAFYSKKLNIYRASKLIKKGVEETGRLYRKKFFEKIASITNSSRILLAHHNNDQIETFLMRFIRGSSLKGLSSMMVLDGLYFRPLLNVSKNDINEYSKVNNISWVEDDTNIDEKYTRNYIRKNLVPLFFNLNPNFNQTLEGTLNHISEQNSFIQNYINSLEKKLILQINSNGFVISLKKFNKLSLFEKRELLFNFLSNKVKKEIFISFKNINDIVSLASSKNASGKFFLTSKVQIQKGYDFLFVEFDDFDCNYNININSEGCWKDNNLIIEINKSKNKTDKSFKFFNLSSSKINIKVRNFKNGDKIKIKNLPQKKLQDVFVDNKIPQFIRSKLPVFETNGEIFYIYGLDVETPFSASEIGKNSVGISVLNKNLTKLINAINP